MEVCVYRKYENKLNFKQMLKILLKNYSDNMHTTYFSFSFFFKEPYDLFQTGKQDNAFAFVTDLGPHIHIELQRDTRCQRQMQLLFSF